MDFAPHPSLPLEILPLQIQTWGVCSQSCSTGQLSRLEVEDTLAGIRAIFNVFYHLYRGDQRGLNCSKSFKMVNITEKIKE